MIGNRIELGSGVIIIFDVLDFDMEIIQENALDLGCRVRCLADDGTYYTVEIAGTENELFNFMRFVFGGLNGVI